MLINDFDQLYHYLSFILLGAKGSVDDTLPLHKSFMPLCDVLNENIKGFDTFPCAYDLKLKADNFEVKEPKKVIVMFSGGKVSLAVTLFLMRQEKYEPILFYVKCNLGNDRSVGKKQEEAVKILADKLNLPLVVKSMALSEKNPLYKMRMINEAIKYAVSQGYSHKIITGMYDGASLRNNPFEVASNTREFRAFQEKIIRTSIKDFRLTAPMPSVEFMWQELVANKGLIKYIFSETFIDRYLLYMYSVDHDLIGEENTSLYVKYIHKLRRELERATRHEVKNVEMLWQSYFFYNIRKSKHYFEVERFLE
jgi:hypothetical protein